MSAWTWKQAIWESNLGATTKIVLQALASHLNDFGDPMFPSQERLARLCSLSERAVITHLQVAEEEGWIQPRERELKGKKWAANEYVACWPDGVKDVHANSPSEISNRINPSVSPQSTKVPKRGSTPLTSIAVLLEDLAEIPDEFRARSKQLPNIDDEWARFRNHHISMRSKHTRLDLCWDTWCRNATKFAARSSAPRSAATGQGGTGSRDVMASAKRSALAELTGQRPEGLRGQAPVSDYPTSDHTRAAGRPEAIGMGAGSNHQAKPGQHAGADGSRSDAVDWAQMEDIWGRGERQDEPEGVV